MRILITGANGLVGQGVLQECLRDPDVSAVVALGRRPSGQSHPKLSELSCADFSRLRGVEDQLHPFGACLYCAGAPPIGTPEMEYRHVTLELTTHVAKTMGRLNPDLIFIYVSGAHSNANSRIMPLRVKGETEDALSALPIRTVMLRPGGIQPVSGVRSPHTLMAAVHAIAGPLMGLGVRLLPGVMTTTERVGKTMLAVLKKSDAHAVQPPAVLEPAVVQHAVLENADINLRGA